MLLAFQIHEIVKQNAVNGDERDNGQQIFDQQADVGLMILLPDKDVMIADKISCEIFPERTAQRGGSFIFSVPASIGRSVPPVN
jgi:hypothetical protein